MSHPLPLLALLAAALGAPAAALAATATAANGPAAVVTTPAAAAAGEPPLTLGRAEETALANHPALRAAAGQVRVARARVGQADATLLPQAALTGTASLFGPSTVLPSGQSSDTTSVGLALSGSQRLFDLGSWYRSVAARASAGAQEASARATRLDVLLEVRTSWFLVAAARDLVVVAQENLANREAHLTQVQGFIEVGTRPAIDLAQARADRATAEVARLTAENDLAAAHARLNLAMGVIASVDYPLAAAEYPALAGEDRQVRCFFPLQSPAPAEAALAAV
jgi:outer membrane protein